MNLIKAIEDTRNIASSVVLKCLDSINGATEKEIRDKVLVELSKYDQIFPLGWYDPPYAGVAVLFGNKTYDRLKFESLRDPAYLANDSHIYNKESVGILYLSPVDRQTGIIGDFGLTIYNGNNETIRKHIRHCYDLLFEVANYANVGMSFSSLYDYAIKTFIDKGHKKIAWMSTTIWEETGDNKRKINFGHTVPGSYGDLNLGNSFDEIKESIRVNRLFIEDGENFMIPETCGFTLEFRLTDEGGSMPNTHFHLMIVFENGERKILSNFNEIFIKMGMDYML